MKKKKKEDLWQRIKKIEFKPIYVVIVVVIAVVLRYWGENTITLLQRDVPIITTTEISRDELTKYIQTKQQYLAENIQVSPFLVEREDFETVLDDDTHEWFLVKNWRPKRFFYVDDRVKLIVSLLNEQIRKLDEAKRLEEQADYLAKTSITPDSAQAEKAAYFSKKAEEIRYYINRNIRNAGITKREENAVRAELDLFETLTER